MKPLLVIGLGNPLMGDDGVGCEVAERLAGDPRLPGYVEVLWGGSDLLRYAGRMEGRSRVVVLDAFQDDSEPGRVARFEGNLAGLDDRQEHAHQLSAAQAVGLIQMITPIQVSLFGICIPAVTAAPGLSHAVVARIPEIVESVLRDLNERPPDGRGSPKCS